jgi:hypothetical protein
MRLLGAPAVEIERFPSREGKRDVRPLGWVVEQRTNPPRRFATAGASRPLSLCATPKVGSCDKIRLVV